jgi:small-conductance mechanosensitive channel
VSAVLGDSIALWSAALIIGLPALIIAAGELQERLRQRGSALERPVATLRNWVLPLATLWALVVLVLGFSREAFFVRVLATVTLVALTTAILQLVSYGTDRWKKRSDIPGVRQVPQLLLMLPRLFVLLVVGWFLLVVVWNVDLSGALAALGVTSLIISLALQPTLSSLASGLLLLGDRPFDPGDWIEVEEVAGRVVDVNWRTTRVETRDGDVVVFPNSTLSDANIINRSQPARLHRVVVSLTVAYSNPPTLAKEMLLAAARATEGVLEDPPPDARVTTIDDPLMGWDVHLWVDDYAIAPRVRSDFGALVWYQSERMGVPLPSPAFDLYHHDPIQEAADKEPTLDELVAMLGLSPVLEDLSQADLAEMADAARLARYRADEHILAPDSVDPDTYVLWEGRARIVVPDAPQRAIDLAPGDIFGVMSGTARLEHPPGVVAVTDCLAVVVEGSTASAVASRNPDVTEAWNKILTTRSRRVAPERADEGGAQA